jgi:hypothetical protein
LPARLPPVVPDGEPSTSLEAFDTPSGNIHCSAELSSGEDPYLQCLLDAADFALPTQPAGCEGAWIPTEIDFVAPLTSLGGCRSDVPVAQPTPGRPVLEYRRVNDWQGVRCLSETVGLACWDPTSGHGFFVSKSVFATY